jgi:hypothetical protein
MLRPFHSTLAAMKWRTFAVAAAAFAAGVALTHVVHVNAADWAHGPAKRVVLAEGIRLSPDRGGCPGAPEGLLGEGTIISVRSHGPVHRLTVDALVSAMRLPVRELTSEEAATIRPMLECSRP